MSWGLLIFLSNYLELQGWLATATAAAKILAFDSLHWAHKALFCFLRLWINLSVFLRSISIYHISECHTEEDSSLPWPLLCAVAKAHCIPAYWADSPSLGLSSSVNSDNSQIFTPRLLSWVSVLFAWHCPVGTQLKRPQSCAFLTFHACYNCSSTHLYSFPQVRIINHSGAKKKPESVLSDSKWHPCIDTGCLTSPLVLRSWTELTAYSLIFDLDPAHKQVLLFASSWSPIKPGAVTRIGIINVEMIVLSLILWGWGGQSDNLRRI